MNRSSVAVLAASLLVGLASRADAQSFVGWHNNLKRAAEVSSETGKPMFVVFRCER